MEWPFSKRPGEKREPVSDEKIVVQDPVTGSVIGEAASPEEAVRLVRDNTQEWKEAA